MWTWETDSSIHFGARAVILDETFEKAWAEKHIVSNPWNCWILGKYVEADNANENRQYFPLDGLKAGQESINYAPLNINHTPIVIGCMVANELVYPLGDEASAVLNPFVDALSVMWKFRFPDEYDVVETAHKANRLAYSMEAIPEKLRCEGGSGCGMEFAYDGRISDTYCDHLNEPTRDSWKVLVNPHFIGSALIVPPARPGWTNATIEEISRFLHEEAEQAESVYDNIASDFPELDPSDWEELMLAVMDAAYSSGDPSKPKKKKPKKKEWAAGQIPKASANYRPAVLSENCFNCRNSTFLEVDGETYGACSLVEGAIAKQDVCDLHEDAPTDVTIESWPSFSYDSLDEEAQDLLSFMMYARSFSADQRKKMASEGTAMKDGSFPIANESDLKNAIRAVGRAKNSAAAKRHIKKRAKSLGKSDLIPGDW